MNTLLETIYNLLSYVTEDQRAALPEQYHQPMADLMTLLENDLWNEIVINKFSDGELELHQAERGVNVIVRDYSEDAIETLRENVRDDVEVAEALDNIKTDEHGRQYLEHSLLG